jgi:DNA-binding HxlR family transcriptional regulator
MSRRAYGQYCGFARALEMVGERWALLIVRDLLIGPRRFTDLRRGLPRIPTNVLAGRLKELEEAGIVQRRVLARPDGSVVYQLTEYGSELEDIVLRLGRWGARSLGEPRAGEVITPDAIRLALRATFDTERARGVRASYELRLGPVIVNARVDDGRLVVGGGPLPEARLVIETGPAIRALMAGELSPAEATASGAVRLTGDPQGLDQFVELFRIGR